MVSGLGATENTLLGMAFLTIFTILSPPGWLAIAAGAFARSWQRSLGYGVATGFAIVCAMAVAAGQFDKAVLSLFAFMVPTYALCGLIGRGVRWVIAGDLAK